MECRPASLERGERVTKLASKAFGYIPGRGRSKCRGLMSELGESLKISKETSLAGQNEAGGRQEMNLKKQTEARSHRVS